MEFAARSESDRVVGPAPQLVVERDSGYRVAVAVESLTDLEPILDGAGEHPASVSGLNLLCCLNLTHDVVVLRVRMDTQ